MSTTHAPPTALVPPQNLEAEEAVLGAMLLSETAIGAVTEILDASHFYRGSHGTMYRACLGLWSKGEPVDYVAVCSPNYLHEPHCRFALRYGSDVVCEKPLVLHPDHIDELATVERNTGKKIFTILQLRLHDAIRAVKENEVRRILGQLEQTKSKPTPTVTFRVADHVRVVDGPFSGFTGVVDEVNNERGKIKVMVSIFGRATPVELDFLQVQPV